MTEDVLQFIWQSQSFNKNYLQTTDGQVVRIYEPGILNSGSGPDFAEAKITLDGLQWSGDIEIHSNASHWQRHNHHKDRNYDRVILHVVWQEDKLVFRSDQSAIPTLELRGLLNQDWYERYQHLMNSIAVVPCEAYLPAVDQVTITDSIQSALVNRLERKSAEVRQIVQEHKGDWHSTSLIWLVAGFGFQKNKAAFQQLARAIDTAILRKLDSVIQLEAYLFGLSGLLPGNPKEYYVRQLREEYEWLTKKYNLKNKELTASWWKFMRLRPANFPTLRLAQLASFLFQEKSFMRSLLEKDISHLQKLFALDHPVFWQSHYHFNKKAEKKLSGMGKASQSILLINVVAVLLVAYGTALGQTKYITKAVELLENMKPEANKITRLWESLGIRSTTAADSQGLIGLFNDSCKKSGCLSCSIGKHILKTS